MYDVNVQLALYPLIGEADSWQNISHVIASNTLNSICANAQFTATFTIIMRSADKRILGLHLTLLASISNASFLIHKVYIYKVIDLLGLFKPNIALCLISLAYALWKRKEILNLQKLKRDVWKVSDSVLNRC